MNQSFFFFLFLLLCLQATAQQITGVITNEKSEPLSYANIIVMEVEDSMFVTGSVSAEDGRYSIDGLKARHPYLLRVSCVGYISEYKHVQAGSPTTWQLKINPQLLQEVSVESRLPQSYLKGDAVVTQVQGSVLEKTGTAENLLDKIPGVSAQNGKLQVFGRGTPEVYINNRKVRDANELDQLYADNIQLVEVVSLPGARYDATVKAVIRIQTKKAVGEGWGFDSRVRLSNNQYWSELGEMNFRYRKNKWDLAGMVYGNNRRTWDNEKALQKTFLADQWQQTSDLNEFGQDLNLSGRLTLNYVLSETQSMGIRYDYKRQPKGHHIMEMTTDVLCNDLADEYNQSHTQHNQTGNQHQFNAYYHGVFNQWTIDVNADGLWKNYNDYSNSDEKSHYFVMDSLVSRTVHSQNRVQNGLYALKAELSHPLAGGKVVVGSEYTATYRSDVYRNEEGIVNNSDNTLKEKTMVAYVEYSRRFGYLMTQAGLRVENVFPDYYLFGVHQKDLSKNYKNVFPSLSVVMPLSQKTRIQGSYATDISRPKYDDLSGNISYANRYTYESGNPLLKPTIYQNIGLAVVHSYLQLAVGYQRVNNDVVPYIVPYSSEEPRISLIKRENISAYDKVYASFTVAPTLFDCWHPQWIVQCQKQNYVAESTRGTILMNRPVGNFTWKNTLQLPKHTVLDVNASFRTKGDDQNLRLLNNSWVMSINLNKSFFEERLNLLLRMYDVFNTSNNDVEVFSGPIRMVQLRHLANQQNLSLTLRYKLNSGKNLYRGTGAGLQQQNRM